MASGAGRTEPRKEISELEDMPIKISKTKKQREQRIEEQPLSLVNKYKLSRSFQL